MKKKVRGFTLVELMMVIAIITVLAIVLIPKMLNTKDMAYEMGIKTNMRTMEAAVGYLLPSFNLNSYSDTYTACDAFEYRLMQKVSGQVVNPYSRSGTVYFSRSIVTNNMVPGTVTSVPDDSPAIAYSDSNGGIGDTPYENYSSYGDREDLSGTIFVAAYYDMAASAVKVDIFYWDKDGKICSNKDRVVVD